MGRQQQCQPRYLESENPSSSSCFPCRPHLRYNLGPCESGPLPPTSFSASPVWLFFYARSFDFSLAHSQAVCERVRVAGALPHARVVLLLLLHLLDVRTPYVASRAHDFTGAQCACFFFFLSFIFSFGKPPPLEEERMRCSLSHTHCGTNNGQEPIIHFAQVRLAPPEAGSCNGWNDKGSTNTMRGDSW